MDRSASFHCGSSWRCRYRALLTGAEDRTSVSAFSKTFNGLSLAVDYWNQTRWLAVLSLFSIVWASVRVDLQSKRLFRIRIIIFYGQP